MPTGGRSTLEPEAGSPSGPAADGTGAGDGHPPPSTAVARRGHDLRPYLPGVEPDRRLTDWGRSERIEGLLDRTLAEFLYRYWFRCEVEGVDNVPATGGALLVANHAGALPPDAAMIAKAIREEHTHARPLSIAVEQPFKNLPGVSMLLPKIGCVEAHPANVHRLLHDEEALVLAFPEGRRGARKLYKDRYRLRRFGPGHLAAAAQARVPVVPVCLIGGEEAAPTFANLDLLGRRRGLASLPLTPTFPHFGLPGVAGYLPAKFSIRFLEPVELDLDPADRGEVGAAADAVRAMIQDNLFEMLGERDSIWLG